MLFESHRVGSRIVNGRLSTMYGLSEIYTLSESNVGKSRYLEVTETELKILLLRVEHTPFSLSDLRLETTDLEYIKSLQTRFENVESMMSELLSYLKGSNLTWLKDNKLNYLEKSNIQYGASQREKYVYIRIPLYLYGVGLPAIHLVLKKDIEKQYYKGFLELTEWNELQQRVTFPSWVEGSNAVKWMETRKYLDVYTTIDRLLSRVTISDIRRLQSSDEGFAFYVGLAKNS